MAQTAGSLEASATNELMQLVPLGGSDKNLSRAVFAVNDAGNLADALDANLEWMAQAMRLESPSSDVKKLLREAVDVCRQLTRLLGGALGSYRAATNAPPAPVESHRVLQLIEGTIRRVSKLADSLGILVLNEGPADLFVPVDRDLMNTALETLLVRALHTSPPECVVRINYTRCGNHAVIGLTSEGSGLTALQLEQLHTSSVAANVDGVAPSLDSDLLRSISTMLFEQGGYIDAEDLPEGGTTLFIVVPTSEETIEAPAISGTVLADDGGIPRQEELRSGQKRSEKMIVQSDRFGSIEVDATDVLAFPGGIIGFPRESEFILVRKTDSQVIGWLQSTKTSYLTLPVVSAHVLAPQFPDVPLEDYAERAGLGNSCEELAVLAVLSAPPGQPATVNLMAPIIVNATTRLGAQVMIEGTRFSTRELFIFPVQAAPLDLERTATAMPSDTQSATSAAE